jgi:hypothetical protein
LPFVSTSPDRALYEEHGDEKRSYHNAAHVRM